MVHSDFRLTMDGINVIFCIERCLFILLLYGVFDAPSKSQMIKIYFGS